MLDKIKIALILPSLQKKGPVIVALDIAKNLSNEFRVEIFYFDKEDTEIKTENCTHIKDIKYSVFKSFDIVHSHGLRADLLSFYLKIIYPKLRTISTFHNFVFEDLNGLYGRLKSFIYGYIWIITGFNKNKIITLTSFQKSFYTKYYPKNRISVIGNGRAMLKESVENMELQKSIDIFKGNHSEFIHLGTTSLLIRRKGLHQVLHAMTKLERCTFIIVGDGVEIDNLKNLAKKLNIYERCLFTGFYKNNSYFFKSIDVFLLTSYSEAFPLSLIEASLYGIKSVCSNLPTLKEILPNHLIEFYNLDDISDLINAIELTVAKGEETNKLIMEYSKKELTEQKMTFAYANIYKRLHQNII